MQIPISKNTVSSPELFLERAGYHVFNDRKSGKTSFVRRLHRDLYPRFHAYVEDRGEQWMINLHLDQRAPVYAGVTAHAGEYDGPVVEKEGERIKQLLSGSDTAVSRIQEYG